MEKKFIDDGDIIDAVEDFKRLGTLYVKYLFRAICEGEELDGFVKSGLAEIGIKITNIIEVGENEKESTLREMETAYNKGKEQYEREAQKHREFAEQHEKSTAQMERSAENYNQLAEGTKETKIQYYELMEVNNKTVDSLKAQIAKLTERLSKYEGANEEGKVSVETDNGEQLN